MRPDVIVVGGGAGGMTAAAVASAEGLRVLLVEKAGVLGGTTAVSGGMVWAPGNVLAREAGQPDSIEAARLYLAHCVTGAHNAAVREAFLTRADEAVAYLARHTLVQLQPVRVYPDYYPDVPGAALGGRVLEPAPFDARVLGDSFTLVRAPLPEFTLFGGMMVARPDLPHFRAIGRSLPSTLHVLRLLARHARERLSHPRGTSLVLGNALAARLAATLLRQNVTLRLNATVSELIRHGGTVTGAIVDGELVHAGAVVLATGGFSHSALLRSQLLPNSAGMLSAANQDNTGDGIGIGLACGGNLGPPGDGGAFWAPVSKFVRPDGSAGLFPHTVTDRGKPGAIAVDGGGQRFVNEAVSYHEFVRAMLRLDNAGGAPVHLLCDRDFLWRYGLGAVRPMSLSLRPWLRSGYLKRGARPGELAVAIGVPPAALERTVAEYNACARVGTDPKFDKGGDAYQRYMGDAANQPNPCVAPLEHPPFFAVALYPGDLGTSTGLQTDAEARVLDREGAPIPGLYSVGNDMHSVMNGAYPGPGITLGPALTFGYIAARSIAARLAQGETHVPA